MFGAAGEASPRDSLRSDHGAPGRLQGGFLNSEVQVRRADAGVSLGHCGHGANVSQLGSEPVPLVYRKHRLTHMSHAGSGAASQLQRLDGVYPTRRRLRPQMRTWRERPPRSAPPAAALSPTGEICRTMQNDRPPRGDRHLPRLSRATSRERSKLSGRRGQVPTGAEGTCSISGANWFNDAGRSLAATRASTDWVFLATTQPWPRPQRAPHGDLRRPMMRLVRFGRV
jgi:hypothetical protein